MKARGYFFSDEEFLSDPSLWLAGKCEVKKRNTLAPSDFGVIYKSYPLTIFNLTYDCATTFHSVDEMLAAGWFIIQGT